MPIHIQAPDGSIAEFPDGTPDTTITSVMARTFGGPTPAPKRSMVQDITGFMANLNRSIPGADEAADTVQAGVNLATGKAHDIGQAWQQARTASGNAAASLRQAHPVAADLATGTGYVAQALPALLSGGATLAPEAAATPGLKAMAGRVGLRTAKNATVGATYAAVNSLADQGSAADRVRAANSAIIPGAVAGVALPAAVAGAGKVVGATGRVVTPVVKTAVRAANLAASKTPAGPFLDPAQEATNRLAAALTKDGFTPDGIRQALTEWQRVGGPSPAFMDLVAQNGGGQNTMALVRGAAMTGSGRNVAARYGNQVAADLQDNAIDRTRALVPGDTRTIPAIEADVQGRIAANSQGPAVTPGRGGAAVHARLNERFDQGRAAVNQAYDAVRNSDAVITAPTLTELPGRIRAGLHESMITPETMGSLDPGTRSILGEIDRLSGGAGRLDAAAQPNPAASLEVGIPTGARGSSPKFLVGEIERVRKAINARLQTAQGEDRVALQIAKREFDGWLNDAVDNGHIQGDPQAVGLLRTARGLHADQQRQFAGDDLIQKLTERDRHGAGNTNLVAPEDASNTILGRVGLSPRLDLHRDLARVRDTLGEQSPEWQGLRQEALSRVLGRDAGSENYGQAFAQFERQSPELARLLMTPADRAGLLSSRANIASAVADRNAVTTGQGLLNASPDQYAADVAGAGARAGLLQVGGARSLEAAIGRPTEGATGVLNRLATGTNTGRNLAATYGKQPAQDYRQALDQIIQRVQNARYINPNTGSQTAGRLVDESLVEIPTSKSGLIMALWRKLQSGATLTDAEREAIVKIATSQAANGAAENLPALTLNIGRSTNPEHLSWRRANGLLAVPAGQSQRQK